MASSTSEHNPRTSLHIVFVCTGNICRSPMGDVILRSVIEDEGLEPYVTVSSCGTGGWHIGQKADKRALAELRRAGYDGDSHRAAQLGEKHEDADLFIALDSSHRNALLRYGFAPDKVRLLRTFDPAAHTYDVEDPYYGDAHDFEIARVQIESAMPQLLEWIKHELQEKR
ncbi:low molecular weight protein-tyrosine-phosphatase [Corynebacterium ulcerans]|uniref:low molecular weight protein-tyrosine-phosphatase n=1 Tax=Corynebacterium ulcerans TaxID=65058 RepID=UPI000269D38A|nr:Low molecular weight protein-tyrosine-phosphatase [Corynebacterium ulcerans]BAM27912.1 protein-tyrosine-phosphatase [Corynebacterium ulcerans 0102]AIU92199.1 Low molecular weight protein-tyrosine-phosphatase [Corynebacterium ulcerans]ALD95390.1 Low molecular weight protein-tyrosine-phosphatase [Corynebacterium ulcerans]SQG59218.1 phosphatase [Corynebacterium ulcerans]